MSYTVLNVLTDSVQIWIFKICFKIRPKSLYSSRQKKVHVFAPPYDRATKLFVPFSFRLASVPSLELDSRRNGELVPILAVL